MPGFKDETLDQLLANTAVDWAHIPLRGETVHDFPDYFDHKNSIPTFRIETFALSARLLGARNASYKSITDRILILEEMRLQLSEHIDEDNLLKLTHPSAMGFCANAENFRDGALAFFDSPNELDPMIAGKLAFGIVMQYNDIMSYFARAFDFLRNNEGTYIVSGSIELRGPNAEDILDNFKNDITDYMQDRLEYLGEGNPVKTKICVEFKVTE